MKFKPGQRVIRIKRNFAGMFPGDIAEVKDSYFDTITLIEYPDLHEAENFELYDFKYMVKKTLESFKELEDERI